jgi:glutathione S-transferase
VRAVENVTGGNFLELYHGLASTCSKKVRLCLYEKGLSFKSHLLNLQKFEQHSPEYLALNPNGVVPTLVHHGRPIIESSVIIDYVDEAFEEPPLKPKDAYSRAQMRLWLKFSDDVAYNAVYAPTWMILSKNAMRDKTAEERRRILANIPSKERRERWEVVTRDGFSERELADAYEKMERCLDRAEKTLQTDDWLRPPGLTRCSLRPGKLHADIAAHRERLTQHLSGFRCAAIVKGDAGLHFKSLRFEPPRAQLTAQPHLTLKMDVHRVVFAELVAGIYIQILGEQFGAWLADQGRGPHRGARVVARQPPFMEI